MDILNSEGCILGLKIIEKKPYLKVRNKEGKYDLVLTSKDALEKFFDNKISVKDLISYNVAFNSIDDTYNNISEGIKVSLRNAVLSSIDNE